MDEQSLVTNSTRSKPLIPPTRATTVVSLTHPLRVRQPDRQVIASPRA